MVDIIIISDGPLVMSPALQVLEPDSSDVKEVVAAGVCLAGECCSIHLPTPMVSQNLIFCRW